MPSGLPGQLAGSRTLKDERSEHFSSRLAAGDTVGGRWQIVAEAPGERHIGRFRAVQLDTGRPVELLVLRPTGVHDGPARARFSNQHRLLMRVSSPALANTHATAEHGDTPVVVREPLEDATLADVGQLLGPGTIAAIGARIGPAVLAAGGAAGSALTAMDIGLNTAGHPVLAPRGRPSTTVSPAVAAHVAPEAFSGGEPDGASGLYGLGAVLYTLAAGRPPTATGSGGVITPPSAFQAAVPAELDSAIMTLLSSEPMDRAGALPDLIEAAGPMTDLRPRAAARAMSPGEVRLTTGVPGRVGGRADVQTAVAAVVVEHSELSGLSAAAHSQLAGVAGVPIAAVDEAVREGRAFVIEGFAKASRAVERASELSTTTGLPITAATGPSFLAPMIAVVLAGLLLPLLVLSASFGWWLVAAISGGGIALNLWTLARWLTSRTERNTMLERADTAHRVEPVLRRPWNRLAQLRVQLSALDLPEAAAVDLRGAIKDVERHLQDLGRIGETTGAALAGVDLGQLESRLASLTARSGNHATAAAERDRLARTITDISKLQQRRADLTQDAKRVDDALDDLAGMLAQLADVPAPDTAALDRLRTTTRLTREAIAESTTPAPPTGRGQTQ